jgi:hypothetical protein
MTGVLIPARDKGAELLTKTAQKTNGSTGFEGLSMQVFSTQRRGQRSKQAQTRTANRIVGAAKRRRQEKPE